MQHITTNVGDTRVFIASAELGHAYKVEPLIEVLDSGVPVYEYGIPVRSWSGPADIHDILIDATNAYINSVFPNADAHNAIAPF